MNSLSEIRQSVLALKTAVDSLQQSAVRLELPELQQTEWYQLITQKLLPQLSDSTYMVVAVVGGTNIGKSVIFNHLSNGRISATSPLASGTKHPTLLAPARWAEQQLLEQIFQEFAVQPASQAEDALQLCEHDFLFWKGSPTAPSNLLLLDTPDIDSDAEVNWSRADKVRRAADVLIAVLTQQKYNDAAVKKFFRIAATEGKAVIVVFNQCLLPEDELYWPIWLQTFCEQSGIEPKLVYLAPHDRRAAEGNRLPFYLRPWPLIETAGQSLQNSDTASDAAEPRHLLEDIAGLKFAEIKLQTLAGALELLQSEEQGLPVYLNEIRQRAGIHRDAWQRLAERLQEITTSWPTVPQKIVIQEIRQWWKQQRTGWEASVHGFYDAVGNGISWPFRQLLGTAAKSESWEEQYRAKEWGTIQQQLTSIYDRLEMMSAHGHPVLAPRLSELLQGQSREQMIAKLKQSHEQADLAGELGQMIRQQMQTFQQERADWYQLLKRLDTFSAAARPAITIALFATGFGPIGQAVAPVVTDSAMQAALHVAGDVTAGTVTAAIGDQAISGGAATGMGYLEAWFHQLHRGFVTRRQNWLKEQLQQHLWGDLLEQLEDSARLPQQAEYQQVINCLSQLKSMQPG